MQILNNERDILVFENEYICRTVAFCCGKPVHSALTRKASGYTWTQSGDAPILTLPDFDWDHVETVYEDGIVTFVSNYMVRWVFTVSETQPAIRTQLFARALPETDHAMISPLELDLLSEEAEDAARVTDVTERVFHSGAHVSLCAVRFFDRTDHVDSLVRTEDAVLYREEAGFCGNQFYITDPAAAESCLIQKESPCGDSHINRPDADLRASVGAFTVCGSGIDYDALSADTFTAGYPVTIALGMAGEAENEHLSRMVYAADCGAVSDTEGETSGFTPFVMSNTWGDRSQDKCVSETFLKMEILRAVQIGVDIVQIDDGWQKGRSSNSALTNNGVWNGGFYRNDSDFWTPDPEKFPSGFGALCKFAWDQGITLGLWFSPDSENDYANWQRDAATILDLWRTYGICHFKLDGMDICTKAAERNFLRMCIRLLMESEGQIQFQMDITNESRLGYFYEKEMGCLFVENRYTDWGNYYPHNTLRNLWQLAHYIPAQKLLFEVLNPHRNEGKYAKDDILAPKNYDIDYLYASVMASNPLMWCEMQHLPEEDLRRLHLLSRVMRQYRDDFLEIIPEGEMPTGFSLTGFYIRGREHDYYIGLRETCTRDTVHLPVIRILHTNDEGLQTDGDRVVFSEERKYFFAQIEKRTHA